MSFKPQKFRYFIDVFGLTVTPITVYFFFGFFNLGKYAGLGLTDRILSTVAGVAGFREGLVKMFVPLRFARSIRRS
jgi:hypothetical protein